MRRRTFLNLTANAGLGSLHTMAQGASRPNVIVVMTDDQGYGDLSAHGNPVLKTPNLDKWHDTSTRLTDFHVTPMCTPTRSQLLTGRDALANRAMNVSSGRTLLRRDIPTMGDIFRGSGYRTAIFGKSHLGDSYPYRPEDRGFDEAVWFPSSHIGSAGDYWNNDYFNDTYRHNGRRERYEGYCTDVFFGEAIKWMRARAAARDPFLLYVATNAPHGPLFVPERYRAMYASQPARLAAFYGMIANIDENAGRMEQALAETGLRDNTIMIFLTDNGGTAGVSAHNAGMRGQKIGLYDGGHRVPFFIRWPKGGLKAGATVEELASVDDVLPTLIDLCGLKTPAGTRFDGTSLAQSLRGSSGKTPDRTLVVQFSRMNAPRPSKGDACVLWKKWRLVEGKELYDVAADRAQERNVIETHPEVAARLKADYDRWWAAVEPALDTFLPVHIGSDKENPVQLSPTEWADSFLDQGAQIRSGLRRNGTWHVEVEQDGDYEFALRRWPLEVDAPMRSGLPPHKGECGEYPAGVALPVAKAEIEVGGQRKSQPVTGDGKEAGFRLSLKKGRTTLKTWFYDDAGQEICGAYFVYVRRLTSVGAVGSSADGRMNTASTI